MSLRFDHSSGPGATDLAAVASAAAGLDDGEYPAARQQCLTQQGSPEPGHQTKAVLRLVAWSSGSGLQNSPQDYILVTEAICPNCKLIAGMSALMFREPFQRRFA